MGYDPLIKAIISLSKEKLLIEWNSGFKIVGIRDTVYETNNGLDEDDIGYIEYDAAVIRIIEVVAKPNNNEGSTYNWLEKGKSALIEVSLHSDPPIKITSSNGNVIWKSE